jgi:hypothetical protein
MLENAMGLIFGGLENRREVRPSLSIRTISPGSTSRRRAPMASNARSLATHRGCRVSCRSTAGRPRIVAGFHDWEQKQQAESALQVFEHVGIGSCFPRVGLASRWTMISVSVVDWKNMPVLFVLGAEQGGVDQFPL